MAGERTDNGAQPVPEDPQAHPGQAVDALEQRVLGRNIDPTREDEQEDTTTTAAAVEQGREPQDQGAPEAGAEPPD